MSVAKILLRVQSFLNSQKRQLPAISDQYHNVILQASTVLICASIIDPKPARASEESLIGHKTRVL